MEVSELMAFQRKHHVFRRGRRKGVAHLIFTFPLDENWLATLILLPPVYPPPKADHFNSERHLVGRGTYRHAAQPF